MAFGAADGVKIPMATDDISLFEREIGGIVCLETSPS